MHYLLFYEFVPDYIARRAPFRTAHLLAAWKAQERGNSFLQAPMPIRSMVQHCCSDATQRPYRSDSLHRILTLLGVW